MSKSFRTVKEFEFPESFGFKGSAGKTMVKGYARGGSVKCDACSGKMKMAGGGLAKLSRKMATGISKGLAGKKPSAPALTPEGGSMMGAHVVPPGQSFGSLGQPLPAAELSKRAGALSKTPTMTAQVVPPGQSRGSLYQAGRAKKLPQGKPMGIMATALNKRMRAAPPQQAAPAGGPTVSPKPLLAKANRGVPVAPREPMIQAQRSMRGPLGMLRGRSMS